MTLFEIDKAIMDFNYDIDEETGEILNANDLDNLKMERNAKIEGVALWIKNLTVEAEGVKKEKDAMADRQKRLEKKIESLEGYLTYALNGDKFSTPRVEMSFRKSVSVSIPDETQLPKKWLVSVTTTKPDKTAIKDALKAGQKVKGAKLVEKQNLQIK